MTAAAEGPAETDPLRLVVIGDSMAFTDASGPHLPDHPGLYPTIVGAQLAAALDRPVSVQVVARPGQTVRAAARDVTKDRHLQFELLAVADAVIIGVGSFDHAPIGIPPSIEAVVPFLRPSGLRRRTRSTLRAAYPKLVRLTGGYRTRTPRREFDRLFAQLLDHVRWLTQGRAAGVVIGPTSHRSQYYGLRHPGQAASEARHVALARSHGFATVRSWEHVRRHLGELNADGIHWPTSVHQQIADAVASALLAQLTGQRPTIGMPRPR